MIIKTSGEKAGGHPRIFTHRRGQVSGDSLNKPIDKSPPIQWRYMAVFLSHGIACKIEPGKTPGTWQGG